jgi:hypothetical protein
MIKSKQFLFYFGLIFFIALDKNYCQSKLLIKINYTDSFNIISRNYTDSLEIQSHLDFEFAKLYVNKYYSASIDQISKISDTTFIQISSGRKINTPNFTIKNIINDSIIKYENPNIELTKISSYLEHKISNLNNQGYPFAHAHYKKAIFENDTISIYSEIKNGSYYTIGELDQKNEKLLNKNFLSYYIGIKPGEAYNQQKIEAISDKLKRLQYLNLRDQARVKFYGTEADLWILYTKKAINSLDLLLGVTQKNTLGKISYELSGQANAEFINSFKWGESILLKYENLNVGSPKFNAFISFPFIRIAPIGISNLFELYKNKEQFFLLKNKTELFYKLSLNQNIGVIFNNEINDILTIDTNTIIRAMKLPNSLDYRFYSAGLSYNYNSIINKYNPIKGLKFKSEISTGRRSYKSNTTILSVRPEISTILQSQYDSLNQSKEQIINLLELEFYHAISKRNVVKLLFKNQTLISDHILENQKIRIGGYNSIRGFDEEIFLTSSYLIEGLEYRFILDRDSHLSVFANTAQISTESALSSKYNQFYSFGSGMQFKTNIGFFNLILALGSDKTIQFNYNNIKVHFGYSSLF